MENYSVSNRATLVCALLATAAVGCKEWYNPVEPEVLAAAQAIAVSFGRDTDSLEADGTSLPIRVSFEGKRNTAVKLNASLGQFAGTDGKSQIEVRADEIGGDPTVNDEDETTIVANDSVIARAVLELGRKPGPLLLDITVGDFTLRHDTIRIHPSRPESVVLLTSTAGPKVDGSVNALLTAVLARASNKVSEGISVLFEAHKGPRSGSDTKAGLFLGQPIVRSDSNGRASVTFSVQAAGSDTVSVGDAIFVFATVLDPVDLDPDPDVPPDSVLLIAK